jgi:ribosome biogenesis GTPase A
MDMYQKRKNRAEKKNNNQEKKLTKVGINWYPGHMAKTKRLISENINNIDVIYELVDARIPYSSKIKDMDDLLKNKRKILIMTKKDLCDVSVTNKWVKYYEDLGYKVLLVDLNNQSSIKLIIDSTNLLVKDMQEKRIAKGLSEKELRVLVVGIPNVGKSTLINKMCNKKVVTAENRPGVTKNLTYIKTKYNITLLDTPGILWPKLDNQLVALNIASTGGIKSDILNMDEICIHILNFLYDNYNSLIKELYNIEDNDIIYMYETIAKKIGAIKNNEIDYDKVSKKVYNDVVSEKIKGVTFDKWM